MVSLWVRSHTFFRTRSLIINNCCETGLPRGTESIEKALNFKIGFQDLETVLNLAKVHIRY